MKASDSDSGANAEIVYSVSNDHFAVDNNGVISNNKRLDADSNNAYYEFQVYYIFISISTLSFWECHDVRISFGLLV